MTSTTLIQQGDATMTESSPENSLKSIYQGKNILITGSVGTVGSELLRQIVRYDPAEVRLLDNNESGLFMQEQSNGFNLPVIPILGDIRDPGKLQMSFECVDVVFHCAAYKHVTLCESNPFDSVRTNVIGTQNVLKAALANGVKRMIYTSSDKAVNPTNVMGTSKLLSERVVTAASSNFWNKHKDVIFSSTRFGNVLGSNGSVVPIFIEQIKQGGPVTVTNKEMTRFVMTIQEAAYLVIKSGSLSYGGEVMVTKMPVIRILDLAEVMTDLLAPVFGRSRNSIEIKFIGAKPGEKLYEELMTEEEAPRSYELPAMFSVLPSIRKNNEENQFNYPEIISKSVTQPYISNTETPMSKSKLQNYLLSNKVMGEELTEFCKDNLKSSQLRLAVA